MLSHRVINTSSPPLVSLGDLANNTFGCISLGQGAPFYSPPKEFMEKHFLENFSELSHLYTSDQGMIKLRSEIIDKLYKDNKINSNLDEIVVTPGANQAFINILITLTDPGDTIILLGPYYFNHKMACTLVNVNIIEVPLNDNFSINHNRVKEVIDNNKIKAIVLVNPGNPSGAVHSEDDLRIIRELIDNTSIQLISDETYEYFTYNYEHISARTIVNNTISIFSFSKTFGIPGWRLGYYHAKSDFVEQSIKVQDTSVICAPAPSQLLGIKLLQHRSSIIPEFKSYLLQNYKLSNDLISEVKWLINSDSHGAYYLFPSQTTGLSSSKLANKLIIENKVYLVPGDVFGVSGRGRLRVSFANVTEDNLFMAFDRLKQLK